ncbi:MAG: N-glycosylase [Thermodesulfobacteriota bacterium]|nr:MAG: N-glycosylase [Thermodesulfobacteriota bacterium]
MKNSSHYLKQAYAKKKPAIRSRLNEFRRIGEEADDNQLFEELSFCICTAGASAKMGLKSVDAMRDILSSGSLKRLQKRLDGVHRFPNARPAYIVHTRDYLKKQHGFKIRELLSSFDDPLERRDFLAKKKHIKGIGYKEASHFLRNIGFSGYAILDKHILNTLYEFKVIKSPKPPTTRDRYIHVENKLIEFADKLEIHMDELDLLLWSEKTGEILK